MLHSSPATSRNSRPDCSVKRLKRAAVEAQLAAFQANEERVVLLPLDLLQPRIAPRGAMHDRGSACLGQARA